MVPWVWAFWGNPKTFRVQGVGFRVCGGLGFRVWGFRV